MALEGRRVYSVSELAAGVKQLIESTFGRVWVQGEVSNLRQPPSGHIYVSLKDAGAVLGCAVFGGYRRIRSARHLVEGQKVLIYGRVTTYERSGQYQVIVERVEPVGLGELQEKFDKLKKKLAGEGLFDEDRKRPLPAMPLNIGLVTSPTGAAVRDMIDVLTRRFPQVSIILAPTLVQGDAAGAKIAEAIELQNEFGEAEVLIVGRGGGSIEDLWAFNEEPVVRAVAASRIPVISAVGHEVDYTLCDYAADMRAPTPSAAAELAVRREAEARDELAGIAFRLRTALSRLAESSRARLAEISAAPVFSRPLDEIVGYRRQRLDEMALRLSAAAREGLGEARTRTAGVAGRLEGLNPLAVLERGYSVTFGEDGRPLRTAGKVEKNSRIRTVLADGEITSRVEETSDG